MIHYRVVCPVCIKTLEPTGEKDIHEDPIYRCLDHIPYAISAVKIASLYPPELNDYGTLWNVWALPLSSLHGNEISPRLQKETVKQRSFVHGAFWQKHVQRLADEEKG